MTFAAAKFKLTKMVRDNRVLGRLRISVSVTLVSSRARSRAYQFSGYLMTTDGSITLGELRRAQLHTAAQILGRAMRDNPIHVQIFGIADEDRRRRALERLFRPILLGLYERGLIYGAYRDGALMGICGMARPGSCQLTALEKLRVLPGVVFGNPLRAALRLRKWTVAWAHRDPTEPHWHLGPVAVEPSLQHHGIGTALLTAFCSHVDACGAIAYLETDRQKNVYFYQKFGFVVTGQANVLGVHNWFMSRPGANLNAGLHAQSTLFK